VTVRLQSIRYLVHLITHRPCLRLTTAMLLIVLGLTISLYLQRTTLTVCFHLFGWPIVIRLICFLEIPSATGVEQGDPLSPVCLFINVGVNI